MRLLLIFLYFSFPLGIFGQSFSVSDTVRVINSSISSSTPPHHYIQLINNTSDTLNLRWVEHPYAGFPAAWTLAMQDPQVYHNPTPDSADFYIESPASSTDKLVTNLYHNGVGGQGIVRYKVYDINNPADSLNVYFKFNISDPNDVEDITKDPFNLTYHDGVIQTNTSYPVEISISNIQGQIIRQTSEKTFNIKNLPGGVYIIRCSDNKNTTTKKIYVN